MITIILFLSLYLIGAKTFYAVWLKRFPPEYFKQTSRYLNIFMVKGWADGSHDSWTHEGYYELNEVASISFFFWIPLSIIICIREIFKIIAKGGLLFLNLGQNMNVGVKYSFPKKVETPQSLPAPDPYLEAATQEVEILIDEY